MSGENISRIDELFFDEIGAIKSSVSLMGFISHAFGIYADRYLYKYISQGETPVREFIYPSNDSNRLSLFISGTGGTLDLSGLEMKGRAESLKNILPHLRGYLSADFQDTYAGDLAGRKITPEELQKRFVQLEHIRISLSKNPEKKELAEEAFFTGPAGFFRYHVVPLEKIILDEKSLNILSNAKRMRLTSSKYVDPSGLEFALAEQCSIIQRENSFDWDYHARMSKDEGMPASMFPAAYRLFDMIKQSFTKKSFARVRITDPSEAPINYDS